MSTPQGSQEELVTLEEQGFDWSPGKSIGCFTTLILPALIVLLALQLVLSATLTRLGLAPLLHGLAILFAAVYAWAFAGLCVCLLLYLWLKSKPAAIAVTLVLTILWALGVARYAHIPPTTLSRVLTVLLALGIPVVIALWFLRPFEGPDVWLSSIGWLAVWGILVIGLKEYTAGIVLLLSLLAAGTVFLLGLYITCGLILPFPEKPDRRKVFDFLRDFALGWNYPAYVVVDELREEDKLKERVPGEVYNYVAMGPGLVITDANHAVSISDGVKFKGVYGPGVVFTGYADRPRVIDLRPHSFAFVAETLTKDGIKVRTSAAVAFKIDARGRRPSLDEPLPYSKRSAFQALHAEKVEHIGKGQTPEKTKQRKWYELPIRIGERILQDIISHYTFDDLYGPHQPGGAPPRRAINDAFAKKLAAELEPLGIQLIGGGISDMEPADGQVYVERVRAWQAEWSRKITFAQAEGRAEWLRRVERARAEAQAELILSLGRQLEELSAASAEIRPEATLRVLVSVLDGLTDRESVGTLLPSETLQALMSIRQAMSE